MDTEIILEREGASGVLNLDDDERRMLQELTIEPEPAVRKPIRRSKPKVRQQRRHEEESDDIADAFINPVKSSAPPRPPPEEFDYGHGGEEAESESDGDMGGYSGGGGGGGYGEQPSDGYSSIDDEKADLLNKLARLEKKGLNVNKKLNAYSSINDLRTEVKRLVYAVEVDQSVKFSRRALVACVTGLEFLNKRYNPLEIQLDGWSESIMENIDDYDPVFEELHNKYKGKMEMAPEVKLIMMLGGSATMFHLTNSMFKAAMPNMNDVIKQNPDLVQNMMSAVQNTVPRGQQGPPPAQETSAGERREMQGPGMDLTSLMNGITMPPPPPMNSRPPPPIDNETESVSDIVSMVSGADSDTRDINVPGGKKRRGRPKKSDAKEKKEIAL